MNPELCKVKNLTLMKTEDVCIDPLARLEPEDGWVELKLPFRLGTGYCFGAKKPLINGTTIRLFQNGEWTVGWVYFGSEAAGPPGFAHGGTQSCVLDDVMGAAAWNAGRPSVAKQLSCKYLEMGVSLCTPLIVEAYIESIDGDHAQIWSGIRAPNGKVVTEGEATFVRLEKQKMTRLFKQGNYPLEEFEQYADRFTGPQGLV